MKTSTKWVLVIIALLAVVNSVFVPLISLAGGLIPSGTGVSFFDILKNVPVDAWGGENAIIITLLSVVITSALMFLLSFFGKKGLNIFTSLLGIIAWVVIIVLWYNEASTFYYNIFDFDHGIVSIGMWIALILFVLEFFIAIFAKKKAPANATQPAPAYYPPQAQQMPQTQAPQNAYRGVQPQSAPYQSAPQSMPSEPYNAGTPSYEPPKAENASPRTTVFCTSCGCENPITSKFCKKCGAKMS